MFRYIALLWNSASAGEAQASQWLADRLGYDLGGWRQVLFVKGMRVFVTGGDRGASGVHAFDGGVVLGTLFSRRECVQGRYDPVLGGAEAAVVRTHGRELMSSYWGRYVAFLYDARTDERRVLRDPMGGMPCLWVDSSGGVRICCSWLEDALGLERRRFSVNWNTIGTCLAVSLFHSEHSGLNEVSEVRAGECLCLHQERCSRSFYWSPLEVARGEAVEDSALAAREIRDTTRMCVQAWASRYRGIIHYLSGGLDSAIVLAALYGGERQTPVTALNYFSPGADSDERRYARVAAQRVGCDLVERQRWVNVDLREMLTAHRTAQPVCYFVRLEAGKHEADLARSTGAEGLFSGDGGDAIFFRTPGAATAVDYAHDHGLTLRGLGVALDAACLDDVSVWPILRDMWRYGVGGRRLHSLAGHRAHWGALTAEVIDSVRRRGDFTHPWFRSSAGVARGKLGQAFLLSFAPEFYDPFDRGGLLERACPLLSQPLVELCLRIPTYVLAPGPLDRMLARNAFAADLPAQIRYRRAKGGVVSHVKHVLQANRPFLAELLLDGVLVGRGLLDRKKLGEALSDAPTRDRCWAPEILEYAGIESWVRAWTG